MAGEHEDLGVFTAEWYDGLFAYSNADIDSSLWDVMQQVRTMVTRALEGLRQDGKIGSGLDADVTIHVEQDLLGRLQAIGDELRFVMITSSASLAPLDAGDSEDLNTLADGSRYRISAKPSDHQKCVRCWHHRADVGQHATHSELCGRCIENIEGDGEERRYA